MQSSGKLFRQAFFAGPCRQRSRTVAFEFSGRFVAVLLEPVAAPTLLEAQRRARDLRADHEGRGVHPDALVFCRSDPPPPRRQPYTAETLTLKAEDRGSALMTLQRDDIVRKPGALFDRPVEEADQRVERPALTGV